MAEVEELERIFEIPQTEIEEASRPHVAVMFHCADWFDLIKEEFDMEDNGIAMELLPPNPFVILSKVVRVKVIVRVIKKEK